MQQTTFIILALTIAFGLGFYAAAFWKESQIRRRLDNMLTAERAVANENSDTRVSMMAESQRALTEMKPEVDQIALFLRENYAKEIERGFHAGRGFGQIVCGYLGVERAQTQGVKK